MVLVQCEISVNRIESNQSSFVKAKSWFRIRWCELWEACEHWSCAFSFFESDTFLTIVCQKLQLQETGQRPPPRTDDRWPLQSNNDEAFRSYFLSFKFIIFTRTWYPNKPWKWLTPSANFEIERQSASEQVQGRKTNSPYCYNYVQIKLHPNSTCS